MTYTPNANIILLEPHLSRSQQSFLKLAMRVAEASECNQRHGAIVVRAGSVLSTGLNKWRNDILTSGILFDEGRSTAVSVHAEIDALSRAKYTKGATLYIARINKKGTPRFSKPCKNCAKAIKEAGISKIIYTTNDLDLDSSI